MLNWWGFHLDALFHWLGHLITLAIVAWIHQERQTLKDVLEGHLERRSTKMNIFELLKDAPQLVEEVIVTVNDVKAVLADLQADPKAQKALADILALESKIKAMAGQPVPATEAPKAA